MDQKAIKLSDSVLIHCPEKGFAMRRAALCFMCQYYNGIMKATERGEYIEGNEAEDFQIICGRPITRKLIQISED